MSKNKTGTETEAEARVAGSPSTPETHAAITDAIRAMERLADEEASRSARATYETESRESEAAEREAWAPAGVLPDPPHKDGWVHHWVRASSHNVLDSTNMAKAMREGWRPCPPEEYPEIMNNLFYRGENPAVIEFGGLVLCRISTELAKARADYHAKLNRAQFLSVNEKVANADPRIRLVDESRSVVKRTPY